jgi:lysine 2,3-aminomutase
MMAGDVLRRAADFVGAGLVPPHRAPEIARVLDRYAAAMSPDLVALVDPYDAADPIARQFVPDARELDHHPAELRDPIGDDAFSPVRGIVHRYPDRVLLKVVAACPVYCRFCFRRESVGEGKGGLLPERDLEAAFDYIAGHPEIWEVILTGGDPLALASRRLDAIMRRLGAIAHVKTIRIHTRVPVVLPLAVDGAMIAALKIAQKPLHVALHANHPGELSPAARKACALLVDAGIPMLSQSVLLAGVNDDVDTLIALMRGFVESRVKPYYLHHPDLAPGTAHFRVGVARGRALVAAMNARLSGIARPAYVLDIPGGFGKVPLEEAHAAPAPDGAWIVRDRAGREHLYRDALPPSSRRNVTPETDAS